MAVSDKYIIDVRTKGAKQAGKDLKGIGAGAASMAKSVGIAATALFGVSGLINGLKSVIALEAGQTLAVKKLEQALGKSSRGLQDYAASMQQVTRFGDEVILSAQAQLAIFIKEEDQIKKATQAVLDLASAKEMDLVVAADLVAKSVGSSTNALSRYGISAEGAVGSSERLESITSEIAKLMGGQAVATTDTMTGAIDQMNNAIGDAGEQMGEFLAPSVIASTRMIKSMAESIANVIDDFDRFMTGGSNVTGILGELEYQTILFNEKLVELGDNESALFELGKEIEAQRDAEQTSVGLSTEALAQYELQLKMVTDALINLGAGEGETLLKREKALNHYTIQSVALKKVEIEQVKEMNEEEFRNFEKLQAQQLAVKLRTVSGLSGAISSLAGQHKQGAKVAQRFAQAQATIDTYAAANVALKSYPPPFNYIAMAAVIASGVANVMQIEKQKFAQGGLITGNSHSSGGVDINAEGGEFMLNKRAVNAIGVENLNAMNQGSSGGGAVTVNISGGLITPEFVENDLAEAIREGARRGADFGIG